MLRVFSVYPFPRLVCEHAQIADLIWHGLERISNFTLVSNLTAVCGGRLCVGRPSPADVLAG